LLRTSIWHGIILRPDEPGSAFSFSQAYMLFEPTHAFASTTTFTSILPSCVSVCERLRQPSGSETLPEEDRIASAACMSLARVKAFRLGRACAHGALEELGRSGEPIGMTADGTPSWPAGVVGSITRCGSYCAAAAAQRRDLLSLGIDALRWHDLAPTAAGLLASPCELAQPALDGFSPETALGLIASAKQSIYKAMNPIGATFGYRSLELAFDLGSASFGISRTSLGCVDDFRDMVQGRFVFDQAMVLTSVLVSRWTVPDARWPARHDVSRVHAVREISGDGK
jgi:4'-phosphopantetheinyl transferase EntD